MPIAGQVLIYPMLDDRTGSAASSAGEHFLWNAASNRYGWSSLLGVPAGSAEVPPGAVPARIADLRGLPPAFISVGTLDLFYEEDLEYARRLQAAGVPVQVEVFERAYHGFDVFRPQAAASRRLRGASVAALRQIFSPVTAKACKDLPQAARSTPRVGLRTARKNPSVAAGKSPAHGPA